MTQKARKTFDLVLVWVLSIVLVLQGFGTAVPQALAETLASTESGELEESEESEGVIAPTQTGSFEKMSDEGLTAYVEDAVYAELVGQLDSDDVFVQNVQAVYISQEYIDELSYNSKANIFFGYTIAELQEYFQGERYVYTVDENGQTVVHAFEDYDDTWDQVVKNVAVGGGVILICATVSLVSAPALPAVSVVFATAATWGTEWAVVSAAVSGVTATAVSAIQGEDDMETLLKTAALGASDGFKYGAILGSVAGSAVETVGLAGATLNGLTMNEAAAIQRESKYPLSVIKQFKSVEEYQLYRQAGLEAKMVGNRTALVKEVDLARVDEKGLTNLERMRQGKAPLDANGQAIELHHVNQDANGTLAMLTQAEHRSGGVYTVLHDASKSSTIDRVAFETQKKQFWVDYAAMVS